MSARPNFLLRLTSLLTLLLALTAGFFGSATPAVGREALATVVVGELPPEARQTLLLIRQGGPFPYTKDGSVFGNFEKRLPLRPRGYYREYTVPTPGLRNRGPQRIIAGRDREAYYTADHYRTFRYIREAP